VDQPACWSAPPPRQLVCVLAGVMSVSLRASWPPRSTSFRTLLCSLLFFFVLLSFFCASNIHSVMKTLCRLLVIERRSKLNSDVVRTGGAKICLGDSRSFRELRTFDSDSPTYPPPPSIGYARLLSQASTTITERSHHPMTHVSSGSCLSMKFGQAQIPRCPKWGLPYLSLMNDGLASSTPNRLARLECRD
jgi:hypothetical protein